MARGVRPPAGWHVGLLRGVNVGGHRPVGMADLRAFLSALGLEEPATLLQSGNVVFRSSGRSGAELEALLEREAAARLGLDTRFFVRTAAEWGALVDANPFPGEAQEDPAHLLLVALEKAPPPGAAALLRAGIAGRERLEVRGREAYVVYPDGVGRSKVTTVFLEKGLGRCTARNWNTVLKLGRLVLP